MKGDSRCGGDRLPLTFLSSTGIELQQLIFHGQVVTQLRHLYVETMKAAWRHKYVKVKEEKLVLQTQGGHYMLCKS